MDAFMERLERKMEAHIDDIRQLIQEVRTEFAQSVPASSMDAAACVTRELFASEEPALATGPIDEAMAIAVELARQALQETEQANNDFMKASQRLRQARGLLTRAPTVAGIYIPTANQIALAYDSVQYAKYLIHRASLPSHEEEVKSVALIVRDVLCLQCCANIASDSSKGAFQDALSDAFGRNMDPELNSQFYLSRSAIRRLGLDRREFNVALPKAFKRPLSAEQLSQLFVAYSAAAAGADDDGCRKLGGRSASRQRPPKKTKPQLSQLEPPALEPCVGGEAVQGGDVHPPQPLYDGTSSWGLGDPMKVSLPNDNPAMLMFGIGEQQHWRSYASALESNGIGQDSEEPFQ